jgi:hypothetical protein
VLLDPSPSTTRMAGDALHADASIGYATGSHAERMAVDTPAPAVQSRVLKIIKKLEVQILCTQHNPVCLLPSRFHFYDTFLFSHIHTYDCYSVLPQAVAAQKKASKQDKIRSELLALPSMARIKIRVSAGVFEVSLIRVIEETSSVEVVWDRGVKREFKWGSVVFGNTDGPVQQKPSEILPMASERKSLIFMCCSGGVFGADKYSPLFRPSKHAPGAYLPFNTCCHVESVVPHVSDISSFKFFDYSYTNRGCRIIHQPSRHLKPAVCTRRHPDSVDIPSTYGVIRRLLGLRLCSPGASSGAIYQWRADAVRQQTPRVIVPVSLRGILLERPGRRRPAPAVQPIHDVHAGVCPWRSASVSWGCAELAAALSRTSNDR